jgi:hypothetical protein
MSLVLAVTVLSLSAAAPPAAAKPPQLGERHFLASIETEYSHTSYKVFEKEGRWFCHTRGLGSLPLQADPLEEFDFRRLISRKPAASCRQKVRLQDSRGSGSPRVIEGCYTDRPLQALLLALDRRCNP